MMRSKGDIFYELGRWVCGRIKSGTIPHMTTDGFNRRFDDADAILDLCESPIEEVMQVALTFIAVDGMLIEWMRPDELAQERENLSVRSWWQKKIGRYRVDCLIQINIGKTTRSVVLEFDGHDFHERTKAQAQKDKARDRWLAASEYTVLRFTGSEIWAHPEKCAEEIELYLWRQANHARAEYGLLQGAEDG